MTGFNLHKLIREVCDSSTIADPATLAKEVGKRIGRNQERAALDQALPVIVQHLVSRARTSSSPGGHGRSGAQAPSAAGGRSHKVAAIRETWKKMLRERIAVSTMGNDWKFLADCTADDLVAAAEIREDHAARNTAKAKQFRELVDLVTEYGVETVGDLPDDALSSTLGQAA